LILVKTFKLSVKRIGGICKFAQDLDETSHESLEAKIKFVFVNLEKLSSGH